MSSFEEYADKYQNIRMERRDGILQATLHTNGGTIKWGEVSHREMSYALSDIGSDPETKVVIITGTGDEFVGQDPGMIPWVIPPPGSDKSWTAAALWDKTYWEGKRYVMKLLDIEVPVIGAVNGKSARHSDLALLSDVALASEDATFSDSHLKGNYPPGDGGHVMWLELMGLNRGRYFLMTDQVLSAQDALRLGMINEVLPKEKLLPRAWELAEQLAQKPHLTLRYTRVVFTMRMKRLMQDMLGYGLVLEGLAALDAASPPQE